MLWLCQGCPNVIARKLKVHYLREIGDMPLFEGHQVVIVQRTIFVSFSFFSFFCRQEIEACKQT